MLHKRRTTRGKILKTEIQMASNGNREEVPCYIQHKCESEDGRWACTEYGYRLRVLILEVEEDPDDEYGGTIETKVEFCPYCGYQPERLNPEDLMEEENGTYCHK